MTPMLMDAPTANLDEAAKQDFTAEVKEWLEAFDQVVAADEAQAEAARQRLESAFAIGDRRIKASPLVAETVS